MSYYKSAEDSDYGCRGALNLTRACIREHEIDECRFDISVENENENGISVVWYLRAENVEDKRNWVEVLKSFRVSHFLSSLITFYIIYSLANYFLWAMMMMMIKSLIIFISLDYRSKMRIS